VRAIEAEIMEAETEVPELVVHIPSPEMLKLSIPEPAVSTSGLKLPTP